MPRKNANQRLYENEVDLCIICIPMLTYIT